MNRPIHKHTIKERSVQKERETVKHFSILAFDSRVRNGRGGKTGKDWDVGEGNRRNGKEEFIYIFISYCVPSFATII